ncbi:MAG: hypothetical protein QM503_03880 [Bacteroidota bacterium]
MVKVASSLKLEENLMEKIKKAAEKENRAVNNYIETVLLKHFEEKENKKSGD